MTAGRRVWPWASLGHALIGSCGKVPNLALSSRAALSSTGSKIMSTKSVLIGPFYKKQHDGLLDLFSSPSSFHLSTTPPLAITRTPTTHPLFAHSWPLRTRRVVRPDKAFRLLPSSPNNFCFCPLVSFENCEFAPAPERSRAAPRPRLMNFLSRRTCARCPDTCPAACGIQAPLARAHNAAL